MHTSGPRNVCAHTLSVCMHSSLPGYGYLLAGILLFSAAATTALLRAGDLALFASPPFPSSFVTLFPVSLMSSLGPIQLSALFTGEKNYRKIDYQIPEYLVDHII